MFEAAGSWSFPAHLYEVSGWSAKCADPDDPMTCTSSAKPAGQEIQADAVRLDRLDLPAAQEPRELGLLPRQWSCSDHHHGRRVGDLECAARLHRRAARTIRREISVRCGISTGRRRQAPCRRCRGSRLICRHSEHAPALVSSGQAYVTKVINARRHSPPMTVESSNRPAAPGGSGGSSPRASAGTMITVAPTGAEVDKASVPALPVTLDELVTTAKECREAGAAVIHVHIRGADAQPTLDPGRLKDTVHALRESTDLIVQLSTGGAVTDPFERRLAVLDAAPDGCSLTCGTVNFGDEVFMNPWPFMCELYVRTQQLGVVPEFELFDMGHVASLHRLLDKYGAPFGGHVHCDLVMGVPGGMAGDAATLVARRGGAARGGDLVGHGDRADHAARDVRRARRRRSAAGRDGGHGHVLPWQARPEQRRAGRARRDAGRPRAASGDDAGRGAIDAGSSRSALRRAPVFARR